MIEWKTEMNFSEIDQCQSILALIGSAFQNRYQDSEKSMHPDHLGIQWDVRFPTDIQLMSID